MLARCVKTGRLTVIVSSVPNHVYFADGRIYAVESSFSREGLGSRLVRARKLSEEDLDRALDYSAEHGESLESVLFKWNLVDREDFDAVVTKQIREVVFLLFHMEGEEFVFESGLQVLSPRVLCDVHELIEWCTNTLGAMVPVLRAPRPGRVAQGSILFTIEEWSLVSLVNGSRRISEIAAELGLDRARRVRGPPRLRRSGPRDAPGRSRERGRSFADPCPLSLCIVGHTFSRLETASTPGGDRLDRRRRPTRRPVSRVHMETT